MERVAMQGYAGLKTADRGIGFKVKTCWVDTEAQSFGIVIERFGMKSTINGRLRRALYPSSGDFLRRRNKQSP
jgi:hypothetical protein